LTPNIVNALNKREETEIVAVHNPNRAGKFRNLVDCEIADYLERADFIERLRRRQLGRVRAVFS